MEGQTCVTEGNPSKVALVCVLVLLSREERVDVFFDGSIITAPGGTRTG